MTTLMLRIPAALWLSANGRLHHHAAAARVKDLRRLAEFTARVVAVLDRAVLLTWSERRRLYREWTATDVAAGCLVPDAFGRPTVAGGR